MTPLILDGNCLSIENVLQISKEKREVEISPSAMEKVREGRKSVERIIESGKTAYGVNTGFGKLAEKKIDPKELPQLQLNLIRSHAVGVGERFSEEASRAVMVVRLNTLLRGYSGIRPGVAIQLANFLNLNLIPDIPRYGSLGASGDLAPSAHMALALIGEGRIIRKGEAVLAESALKEAGIRPLKLREKEGLALINGTQVMTGLGCIISGDTKNFLDTLDIASALSLEALGGNIEAFDPRVHNLRPINGQIAVASKIRALLSGSRLLGSAKRVQDPYSLRCIPQVHGAFYETLDFLRKILQTEINSVTDNPIIFPEDDAVISAGNFHGQPIALSLDLIGLALAEACAYSERRTDKLLSGLNSELPLFLTRDSGLSSGMMVLQYTAAALNSKIATLATPAGLWTANVSAGQEDHSSMGVTSALKAQEIIELGLKVLAIELICSCQALELLGAEKLGRGTKEALRLIRHKTSHLDKDRSLSEEVEKLAAYLKNGVFSTKVLKSINFRE
jgi:histidine ammonia-lyase